MRRVAVAGVRPEQQARSEPLSLEKDIERRVGDPEIHRLADRKMSYQVGFYR